MLAMLVAYGNPLTDLPASLAKLKRLNWLEVQMSLMKTTPRVLSKLRVRHLQTDYDGLNRYS
jgi:Leucine-rich repeat (LRR) protein